MLTLFKITSLNTNSENVSRVNHKKALSADACSVVSCTLVQVVPAMDVTEAVEVIRISDDEGERVMIGDENDDNSPLVLYSCFHCSEKFISYRALDSHIKLTPIEELETSLQKYTLGVSLNCKLISELDVETQKKTKCKTNSKISDIVHTCPFKCSLCDNRSMNKSELKLNVKAVQTRKKSYQCMLCDYKGTCMFHLERHIKKCHTKGSQFNCTVCSFKAVSAVSLNRHVKQKHSN